MTFSFLKIRLIQTRYFMGKSIPRGKILKLNGREGWKET